MARDLGITRLEPRVLHVGNNVVVHLAPAPLVAKVCTNPVRHLPELHTRELAAAANIARAVVPVMPPSGLVPPRTAAAQLAPINELNQQSLFHCNG